MTKHLDAGQTLQLDKLVSYTASRDPVPDATNVVERALAELGGQSYEALRDAQVRAWCDLWGETDVDRSDDEAQLAMRFTCFSCSSLRRSTTNG